MMVAAMDVNLAGFAVMEHWVCLTVMLGLAAVSWRLSKQRRTQQVERMRERRFRDELESYARLDVTMGDEAGADVAAESRKMAKRVCRTIAEKSLFSRVAMLLRDAEGQMYCASSAGVDDLTVEALHGWGAHAVEEERSKGLKAARGAKVAAEGKSFAIALGEWAKFDAEISAWQMAGNKERRRWRRGIVAPIRIKNGRLVGALVVCADGERADRGKAPMRFEEGMGPIELLAARLATSLENEAMSERLLRAEKLAGLGQLAGGVAHALNNPLTAVLGFAELIAEGAREERVRKDAETIRGEALKMRDTVERLTEFWRPNVQREEPVDVVALLTGLGDACRGKLEERGVELIIAPVDGSPEVRGSEERLKQVMEHLLNNSAEAIAEAGARTEGHAIRVTVSHDEEAVQLIVSDTGTGFEEPGRVFDPFYTTREPGTGDGLGLSICYGIVREHGGEISAFNLHPCGAAVVVELPVRRAVYGEPFLVEREKVA